MTTFITVNKKSVRIEITGNEAKKQANRVRYAMKLADTLEAYWLTNADYLEPDYVNNIQEALKYTRMQAQREKDYVAVANNLRRTDFAIYRKLIKIPKHGTHPYVSPRLVWLSDQFVSVHNKLVEEENENLGFGPAARQLRREWRKLRRKIRKEIRRGYES